MNWQIILLIIKMTYPVEFCLAVNRFEVILGSKRARVTMHDTQTKRKENIRMMVA